MTVTGANSALKCTPARGIFPLKGLTRGNAPLLKGVHHAQAYDDDHGARESVCLRRVFTAALFLCPLAGTRADPAKNRSLSSGRQTARCLERDALWGEDYRPESSHDSYRSCRATSLWAERLCRAVHDRADPAGLYRGERGAHAQGHLGLSDTLCRHTPPRLPRHAVVAGYRSHPDADWGQGRGERADLDGAE